MWGCGVLPALCLPRSLPLRVRPSRFICANVWPQGLLVLGLPAPVVPHSTSLGPATATRVLFTQVPVSTPPTGLDECLFCISLVSDPLAVRFSVSSGCARRRSVSTYAAILVLRFPSFLWLSNIPLCMRKRVYHIFFICSPSDKHLGCFLILVTINSTTMNMGMQVSLQNTDLFPFDICPVSEAAGSYGRSVFNFFEELPIFHHGCKTLYPYQGCARASFLHTLTNTYLLSFDNSHPNMCEMLTHGGFDTH